MTLLAALAPAQRLAIPAAMSDSRVTKLRDAAEHGLDWLAANQQPNGSWAADAGHKQGDDYWVYSTAEEQRRNDGGHVGVTSLAALAFLAGGHLPHRGKHGEVVQKALDYVLSRIDDNGYITDSGTRMYSHAFATLFLAEIHGMGGDDRVKNALERAVHWIVDNQNQYGGWRYDPFTTKADLSVTVCQLQALRAARNIGIGVPKSTIDAAVAYVQQSRTPSGPYAGLYYYRIRGPRSLIKNREYAINAAAVTALYSAGIYDQDAVEPALDFIEHEYTDIARYYRSHFYYWYGSYYASQALFQAGGARFDTWYRQIGDDLLESQVPDGRWRNDVGPGDVFATAVACIVLQIPQQYLPIFQR